MTLKETGGILMNKIIIPKEKIREWYKAEYKNKGNNPTYGRPEKQLLKFFDFIQKKNPKTILELGCGDGRNLFELAKRGFKVTGIDLAGKEFVDEKSKKEKLKINFIEGDITKLKLNKRYDVIICSEVFHLIERKHLIPIINKIDRVLNKKGFVYIDILTDLKRTFTKTKQEFEYKNQPNYTSKEIKRFFQDYFKNWKIIKISEYFDKQKWPIKKEKYPVDQYVWEGNYIYVIAQKI